MFKFMKSKKGFTLVELMIVVVIMAILVVVAVPIYNSVTDNAREKTCLDNQRQILSTVSNLFMMDGVSGTGGPVVVEFHDGNITESATDACKNFSNDKVTLADIQASFQTVPVCGDEANTLVCTITANAAGTALVTTSCVDANDAATDHVLVD